MMSKPVTSTVDGKYRSSAVFVSAGHCGVQSSVEKGHSADEYQVSRTSGSRAQRAAVALFVGLRPGFPFVMGDEDAPILTVPGGDLVAPPQLPRDAPVLDVVQPLVVGVDPVFREEA
jgi:hypothetical protein